MLSIHVLYRIIIKASCHGLNSSIFSSLEVYKIKVCPKIDSILCAVNSRVELHVDRVTDDFQIRH